MKKLSTILISLILCIQCFAFEVDGIHYEINADETTVSVWYSESGQYSGDIVIPSEVTYNDKTYPIVGIIPFVFDGCSSLTSIEIPNTVTCFGAGAFRCCSKLTSITIPSGITEIPLYCFYGCSSITSIEIPNTVTSLGEDAFSGCSKLTSITIPSGITEIPSNCFNGCSSLTSIELPSTLTEIPSNCFDGCSSLTSIEIPNTVTSLGEDAFRGCSKLASIDIPNGITEIPSGCFDGCSSLTSIEIPNTVISFGEGAFRGCSKLASIDIPNGITEIPSGCFNGCSSLTSIEIPNTVTNYGVASFSGCSKLTSFTIPSGITEIPSSCFNGCSSLTSIEIPNTVTSFGEGSFKGCSKLTSFTIPSGITEIPSNCFDGCSSLTSIEIPNTVISFGEGAFKGCSKLTSFTIPSGITEIPSSCFRDCSSLTSIEIPNTVTSFGEYSFSGCSKLTSFIIPNGITEIPLYCFMNCSSLTSIEIPSTVTSFGMRAFSGCYSLENVYCDWQNPPEFPEFDTWQSLCLFVPCSYIETYKEADGWKDCNIEATGMAQIVQESVVHPICETPNGSITLSVSGGSAPYAYTWSDSETTDLTRTGLNSGEYVFTVTDANGCVSEEKIVLEKDVTNIPIVSANVEQAICGHDVGSIVLSISEGTEPYTFQWNDNGESALVRKELAPGLYSFSVTDKYGCKTDWSTTLRAESFKYNPEIALVSVSQDIDAANLVVWQKEETQALDFYTIYREKTENGVTSFTSIATVPYTETSVFVDENTNTMQQAYKYKISATDYCGQESPLSDYHKTIHLTKGNALQGGINLIWDSYVGVKFDAYSVFRITSSGVEEIAEVSSDTWTYTDLNPPTGTISYYVGIKLPEVVDVNNPLQKAESGRFDFAISNITNLANDGTGINRAEITPVTVYSLNNQIVVETSEHNKITVYSVSGQKIAQTNHNIEGKTFIPVGVPGVYIVVVGDNALKVKVE